MQEAQTTAQLKTIDVEEPDYNYQDDYVYEPTTSESTRVVEEVVSTTTASEYVPTVNTELTTEDDTDDVHETADKHSTTTLPSVETTFTYVEDVDDLENEIPDQLVEESQRVETTWNGVLDEEVKDDETTSTTTVSNRLSSYEKNVDTSKFGDDKEYNVEALEPQVNEHSKQVASGNDDNNLDDNDDNLMMIAGDNDASWQPSALKPVKSYTEIERGEPVSRVEEVEITETRDYSAPDIIYDVTKDGFTDDEPDTFSVPVAVAFNVPETETESVATATTTTESSEEQETTEAVTETESYEPTTTTAAVEAETTTTVGESVTTTTGSVSTTTIADAPTTTVTEEATTTVAATTTERLPTTYSRIYNLIQRNRNNLLATTGRSVFGEVFLGSRPTTTAAPATTTTSVIDLSKSAHKIPNSLWSSFEKSRDKNTDTEEDNTEGYHEASIMSYSTSGNNNNSSAENQVVAELPKPSKHESELLVERVVKETGAAGFVPKRRISSKTKEKWLKDLVQRKYKKPKFPRGPLLPLAPIKKKVINEFISNK